jgi:hypothetical protein
MIELITALAIGAAGHSASRPAFGYPVYPEGAVKGRCQVVIEDMIMFGRAEIAAWMNRWDDKSRRIDIVVTSSSTDRCVRLTRSVLHQIGYTNVVVRNGSSADYEAPPIGRK